MRSAEWRGRERLGRSVSAMRQQSRNRRSSRSPYTTALARACARDRWRRYSMRRSWAAGSNTSCAVVHGSSRINTRSASSGIGPALLYRCDFDGFIERARLFPDTGACGSDAVPPLGYELVADGDLLVPPLSETVALEPGHELVERGARAAHAEAGCFCSNGAPGLLTAEQKTESEVLQVRDR